MTALEQYQDRVLAPVVDYRTEAVHRLTEWASSAQAAHAVAEHLVRTSFVPETFRGKPYEATAAILSGLEMGLSPMASLRSFDIIQGQAAPRAITLRAVAQAHGHDMQLDESTATRCRMRGRRAGSSEWQSVTWTIDRARSLGLTSKHTWKTQPQNMLVARATSELARLIAADAILGIAYSAEELADGATGGEVVALPTPAADADEQPTATGSKRMSRHKKPAADEPEPVTDDDRLAPSTAQSRKAMASFSELGYTDRDDRLKLTAALVGHVVDSWNTLTRDEASAVIEQLERMRTGDVSIVVNDDDTWTVTIDHEPVDDPEPEGDTEP